MNLTSLQRLICLAAAHLDEEPCLATRSALLREAATHLPDQLSARCEMAAAAIDLAESAQLELKGILSEKGARS
jgi:hypothetical protein